MRPSRSRTARRDDLPLLAQIVQDRGELVQRLAGIVPVALHRLDLAPGSGQPQHCQEIPPAGAALQLRRSTVESGWPRAVGATTRSIAESPPATRGTKPASATTPSIRRRRPAWAKSLSAASTTTSCATQRVPQCLERHSGVADMLPMVLPQQPRAPGPRPPSTASVCHPELTEQPSGGLRPRHLVRRRLGEGPAAAESARRGCPQVAARSAARKRSAGSSDARPSGQALRRPAGKDRAHGHHRWW